VSASKRDTIITVYAQCGVWGARKPLAFQNSETRPPSVSFACVAGESYTLFWNAEYTPGRHPFSVSLTPGAVPTGAQAADPPSLLHVTSPHTAAATNTPAAARAPAATLAPAVGADVRRNGWELGWGLQASVGGLMLALVGCGAVLARARSAGAYSAVGAAEMSAANEPPRIVAANARVLSGGRAGAALVRDARPPRTTVIAPGQVVVRR
jgi:hypothetical protein